jgi:hypothetical protein
MGDSGVGLILGLGIDPSEAQAGIEQLGGAMGSLEKGSKASLDQVVAATEPLNKSLLNSHQSVHLLAEEMGIHLPRAVVGGISEMLPEIGSLGTVLLGAFAVEEIVKFGEMVAKDTEALYGFAEAEKAMKQAGDENEKALEKQAKASMSYAKSQLALLETQVARETRYVDQLHEWQDDRVKWLGWFGEKGMELSRATEKIQNEEKSLANLQKLRDDVVKILGEDEVKAADAAAEGEEKRTKAVAEAHRTLQRWQQEALKADRELTAGAKAYDAALAQSNERTRQADIFLQNLIIDEIFQTEVMQQQAALSRTAAPSVFIDNEVTSVKHLSAARKELIGITQDLRQVEDAFKNALKGEMSGLESLTQSAVGIGEQFAQMIGGTKAAAEVKGAFDAALSIEYMAQFIGSWGTDMAALGASIQYGLAATEMFRVAGGGSRGASGGGGGGGTQSSYGRGGSASRVGSGAGAATPGGGAGVTIHNHIAGVISSDNLAQVMAQMSQLAKGGQATLTSTNALTDAEKLT